MGWVKADTKAIQAIHEQVITHNPRVSVSHSDATTWNLHIKAVTEEDSGGYMCQLNTDPMKSQVSPTIRWRALSAGVSEGLIAGLLSFLASGGLLGGVSATGLY